MSNLKPVILENLAKNCGKLIIEFSMILLFPPLANYPSIQVDKIIYLDLNHVEKNGEFLVIRIVGSERRLLAAENEDEN